MRRLLISFGLVLVLPWLLPESAQAQGICSFCKQCLGDPELVEFLEEEITNYYVLGSPGSFNCRPWDEATCSELLECQEGEDDSPFDDSELVALASSRDLGGLKVFLNSHRDRIEVVLERDLILVKGETACEPSIIGVYEVPGLRSALLE